MCKLTKNIKLLVLPDGPIALHNNTYKYSKGERIYIDNLARNYKQLGLATFVLESGEDFYETILHSSFEENNIVVLPLPKSKSKNPTILQKLFQFIFVFLKLIREIKKYDILYLFLPSYPSACSFLICLLYNKRFFIYGADDWVTASNSMFKWDKKKYYFIYRIFYLFNTIFEKFIIKNAIFGVAAGGQLVSKYRNLGCNTSFTIPRMNLKLSDRYERKDTCTGQSISIVSVGNLIHDKAQHILIDAFALACKQRDDLNLIIIGDGPLRIDLNSQVQKLDICTKVHFYGYIENQKQLFDILKKSDIFALSSVTEGFPRVLYEAMCMSLPIVSTNVGGVGYIIKDNYNGLLVSLNDVQALSDAILHTIRNNSLRKMIIKNGGKTFKEIFSKIDNNQISTIHSRLIKEKYLL